MKLSGKTNVYFVLKDLFYLSLKRASENFSEKGMTKHMHMRHMYISIAALVLRLKVMAGSPFLAISRAHHAMWA